MSDFAQIPTNTFSFIQKKAGILTREFDPTNPTIDNSKIIGATTGGYQFSAVPAMMDMGEDIDNCPKGMVELMDVDTWDVTASGTYVSLDASGVKDMVAVADISDAGEGLKKITPRGKLQSEDFNSIWWVGPMGTGDGFVAIHMINAINSGGFKLQTEDNGKGKYSFSYSCHPSLAEQDKVPFEVYVKEGTAAAAAAAVSETEE